MKQEEEQIHIENIKIEYDLESEYEKLKSDYDQLEQKYQKLQQENENIIEQNKKYQDELKSLKKKYNHACVNYVQKDMEIELLKEKKVTPIGRIYDKHKKLLGTALLKKLRNLDGSKRNDSTFILKIVQKVFEGEYEELRNKSACGRDGRSRMPIEKRNIIRDLFLERLTAEDLNAEEFDKRSSRLNELLNSAINNIFRRSTRKTTTCTETVTTKSEADPLDNC